MYCEIKNNKYWVWSSRISSLDCMPQYKFKTLSELHDKMFNINFVKSEQERIDRLYLWASNLT